MHRPSLTHIAPCCSAPLVSPAARLEPLAVSLASAAGIPRSTASRYLQACPSLQALQPHELSGLLLPLATTLSLTPSQALRMLALHPGLLQLHSGIPGVVEVSTELSRVLGVPLRILGPLLSQQPLLLDVPPPALHAQVSRLQVSLGMDRPGVLLMLSRLSGGPQLRKLLRSPDSELQGQLVSLRKLLVARFGGKRDGECRMLLAGRPQLLSLAADAVEDSLDTLLEVFRELPQTKVLALVQRWVGGCWGGG